MRAQTCVVGPRDLRGTYPFPLCVKSAPDLNLGLLSDQPWYRAVREYGGSDPEKEGRLTDETKKGVVARQLEMGSPKDSGHPRQDLLDRMDY